MKKVVLMLMIPFLFFGKPVEAEENADFQKEIIYDILIDRYNNGDPSLSEQVDIDDPFTYNGGDIQGIITKLDDIQELGFTTISLSSLMENAPKGYHGYWIEDFYKVEEQFGTLEDLNELVEEAHKRDIKVIIELVTNYIASSHPIANDPDKEDWIKENKVEPTESTEWLNDVVVLNQENEEVRDYLYDVAEFWMEEANIDGFKLHAADQSSEDFLTNFTEHMKEIDPEFNLLAGILTDDAETDELRNNSNIQAIENGKMYHVMDEVFSQVDQPVSFIYDTWEENKYMDDLLYVDSKNTARFANNVADQGRNAVTVWQLALTYMYTSPGNPLIYQGSELPMYGPGYPENQNLVQFNSPDPDLEEFHNRIASIRSEFPVLSYGDFEQVGTDEGMSLFKRTYKGETMYIAINNDSQSRMVTIDEIDSEEQLRGLLNDNTVRENDDGKFNVGIPRESSEIYVIEENTGINFGFIGFVGGVFLLFVFAVSYLSYKQGKRSQS